MTFSNPRGTHGTTMPGGTLVRWVNKIAARRAKRSDKRIMGMRVLALTTVGRKSGQERTTPVAWFPASGAGWLVVASAGGSASNPDWYRNLAAAPDRVVVEVAGERRAVRARELHGDERAEAWSRITAESEQFAGYQRKTDREIPVVELTPLD
jgi:deazaflavin-dependent oxidoreductase (nitroreductase family)